MYIVVPNSSYLIPIFPLCDTVGGFATFRLIERPSLATIKVVPLNSDGDLEFFAVSTESAEDLPNGFVYLGEENSQWSVEVFTSLGVLQRRFLVAVVYD